MSLRSSFTRQDALVAVQGELVAEMAHTLGRNGRRVETALGRLAAFEAAPGTPEEREALVRAAATAVWYFFIQREACGLRDHRPVIAQHQIPREVLRRLGAS